LGCPLRHTQRETHTQTETAIQYIIRIIQHIRVAHIHHENMNTEREREFECVL